MASTTKTVYIKTSSIKKFAKSHGKRVSADFLAALDRWVESKVLLATKEHNGGKKTMDASVAGYILGNQ
jgi:hypothetical protein